MNGLSYDFDHGEVILVKGDSIIHMWAMAVGDHWVPLPWRETAAAASVVLWVKEQTDGAAQVQNGALRLRRRPASGVGARTPRSGEIDLSLSHCHRVSLSGAPLWSLICATDSSRADAKDD
jgi:hypothetical protein